jgi:hypothetical protein
MTMLIAITQNIKKPHSIMPPIEQPTPSQLDFASSSSSGLGAVVTAEVERLGAVVTAGLGASVETV